MDVENGHAFRKGDPCDKAGLYLLTCPTIGAGKRESGQLVKTVRGSFRADEGRRDERSGDERRWASRQMLVSPSGVSFRSQGKKSGMGGTVAA